MDFLFFDTETTGLGPCRMIELAYAYAPVVGGLLGDPEVVSFRVRPIIPIEPEATGVHGICDADVAQELFFSERPDYAMIAEVFPQCLAVAHNLPFDRAVMQREGIEIKSGIDTKILARHVWPECPNYKLQTLREYLKIEIPAKAHSAEGDVLVLIEIFRMIQKEFMRIWKDTPEEAISRMARFK